MEPCSRRYPAIVKRAGRRVVATSACCSLRGAVRPANLGAHIRLVIAANGSPRFVSLVYGIIAMDRNLRIDTLTHCHASLRSGRAIFRSDYDCEK